MDLKKIGIRHSVLSDKIYLCRFGKDPNLALDKREIEGEMMEALVKHMFFGLEDARAVGKEFTIGNQGYRLTLKRL